MTKDGDGYAQRASELTALIEALVDDILVAETENARQALADRERRADELAHADLVACREQLRQESGRADREAAEASSLRDEVDWLTRERDAWQHPSTCNTDPLAIRHVSDLLADLAKARNVIEQVRDYLENDCGPFVAADGFPSFRGADRSRLLAILADAEGSGQ